MSSHHRRLALIGLVLIELAGCRRNQAQRALTPIQIAVPENGFLYLPMYVAAQLGYYRTQGLDVIIEDVHGGSQALQAMLGGSADVAGISLELSIQVAPDGSPVKSFLTLIDHPGYVLVVSPAAKKKISTIADLRGAVVGISSPGSGSHNFLNYLLVREHVPLRQVSITGIGIGRSAISAFEHGQLDAAVLTGNAVTAAERRFPKLLILADTRTAEGVRQVFGFDIYPAQGVAARPKWLADHPETARHLTRALVSTMRYMRGHSPQEIYAHLPASLQSPDRAADLEAVRQTIPMLSRDGRIDPVGAESVKKVLSLSSDKVRTQPFDLATTYTNEFVPDPAR